VAPVASEWQTVLCDLLKMPEKPVEPPHYRCLRAQGYELAEAGHYDIFARYAVETERDIRVIIRKGKFLTGYHQTLDVDEDAELYLPNFSSEQDYLDGKLPAPAKQDGMLYCLDLRGMGESSPDEQGSFHQPYGMDYMMHSYSSMFGESYLGRRVYDTLRVIDLLVAEGAKNVTINGRGQGAIIATFVAMLNPTIAHVTLYDAPKSFREWFDTAICDWPVASVPRGVLKSFDLPDLYKALGDRLTIASNWDAHMK